MTFYRILQLLLAVPVFYGTAMAQADSTRHPRRDHSWIVPSALVLAGTATMLDKDADEIFLNNYEVREERNEHFSHFSTHLDDYLQHVPSVTTFVLSLCKVPGRHDLPNQAALFVKSEVLTLSVVYTLKYTVGEARPDTGKKNSFPSGHTAQAFTAASFLAREYGYKSVWIPIGAYATATTVGMFRLLNNRHWVSDVLVGAGLGMLSSELVYRTHRGEWGKNRLSSLSVEPFMAEGSEGLTLRCRL